MSDLASDARPQKVGTGSFGTGTGTGGEAGHKTGGEAGHKTGVYATIPLPMTDPTTAELLEALSPTPSPDNEGRIIRVDGPRLTALGLHGATMGSLIALPRGYARVRALLKTRVELDLLEGQASAQEQAALRSPLRLPAPQRLRGRVISPLGAPLDREALPEGPSVSARPRAPNLVTRGARHGYLHTGITALDLLTPLHHGSCRLLVGAHAPSALQDILRADRDGLCIYTSLGRPQVNLRAAAQRTILIRPSQPNLPAQLTQAPRTALALAQAWVQEGGRALVLLEDLQPLIEAFGALELSTDQISAELGAILDLALAPVSIIAGLRSAPATLLRALQRSFDRAHRLEGDQVQLLGANTKLSPPGSPHPLRGMAGAAQVIIAAGRELETFEQPGLRGELDAQTQEELDAWRLLSALIARRPGRPRSLGEAATVVFAATAGRGLLGRWCPNSIELLRGVSPQHAAALEDELLAHMRSEQPALLSTLEGGARMDETLTKALFAVIERFMDRWRDKRL